MDTRTFSRFFLTVVALLFAIACDSGSTPATSSGTGANLAADVTGGETDVGATGSSVATTTSGGSLSGSGGTAMLGSGGVMDSSIIADGSVTAIDSGVDSGAGDVQDVCGSADEAQSVTLTCPDGHIIDHVVFASYGSPTGQCGSFAQGQCHAASSESMVETLCVGRQACTVTAANGTFGDPCNGTPKSLSVEVACVVGTPTMSSDPYKGIANSPASEIAELGATWCYNWGTQPSTTDCGDPLFVPMVWDGSDVSGAITSIGNAGYTTVLGFNEPNKSDQANMTVEQAIALWPTLTSDPSIRVGSPAVSDDGRAWLESFMTQAQANGLRVDFIAMHWYGWNAGSCTASQLEGAINWASQWGLPVWITEFGCMGSSNTDEQTLIQFFNDAIAMLQQHPLVERYAWYPWNTYNDLYLPNGSGVRARTALGDAFLAAPQYR